MSRFTEFIRRWRTSGLRQTFGLDGLDLKLAKYLDFRNGFFIEAGANDGRNQSNTLYFEKYRRWRGLLIEPIPQLARECQANRPRAIVECLALVPFDYREQYVEMRYCNLMSVVKGGMKSATEEDEHLRQGCQCQGIAEPYALQVPAQPLSTVLHRHGIMNVDLLSLDVEGYELGVLQGIDFERHRPHWLLIEARYRAEIDAYLQPYYEPVAELSCHDVLYRSWAA